MQSSLVAIVVTGSLKAFSRRLTLIVQAYTSVVCIRAVFSNKELVQSTSSARVPRGFIEVTAINSP